jgi:hypothetical protein
MMMVSNGRLAIENVRAILKAKSLASDPELTKETVLNSAGKVAKLF